MDVDETKEGHVIVLVRNRKVMLPEYPNPMAKTLLTVATQDSFFKY